MDKKNSKGIIIAGFLGALTGALVLQIWATNAPNTIIYFSYPGDMGTLLIVWLAGPIQGFFMGIIGGLIGRRLERGKGWSHATLIGGAIGGAIIPFSILLGDFLIDGSV